MNALQGALAGRLAVAAAVGLAAGLEREWIGKTQGANARFAGIRTFFLLGLIGGIAGVLAADFAPLGAALALGAVAVCVAAYVAASRESHGGVDGTTEVAAIAIVGLGVIAGVGWFELAAGGGAVVVLMLQEKERLHSLVRRLGERELHAGVQFVVLAVVVLPLLPTGPFLGTFAIRPRDIWALVLLFSGINFAGFVARRTIGASRGLGVTGAIGGLVSSTAVTLEFSRHSRRQPVMAGPLALGTVAACSVLVPRVVLLSAVLNPAIALPLALHLAPMFLVGLVVIAIGWRAEYARDHVDPAQVTNPLRLGVAIQMALAFQAAILLIGYAQRNAGSRGIFATAMLLGLTDVDALTASMSMSTLPVAAIASARAITVGILANTALKLVVAATLGDAYYRRRVAIGLGAMGTAAAAALLLY